MFKNYKKDKCYIIAEIGGNFINFEQAKRLVDEAALCGVDAVKLQTYKADTVSSKKAMFDMENTGVASQHELFKQYEIDFELHKQIFNYIESKNLDWFSTPSHIDDVILLDKLNVGAHKIGSDDAVNIPFLKEVAQTNKTILLSTGMCTLSEVRESVDAVFSQGNEKLILLHAVTSYPTHAIDVNLSSIVTMMKEFPMLDIGYSDHTIGTTACICAAALGARIVEKHFTYDKNAQGPDHILSADPKEMKEIVEKIREFELMKGSGIKMPAQGESITRINNRKSIILSRSLKKDDIINANDICIKRPGYGIAPKYFEQIVGKKINCDLVEDEVLKWEYIS